MTELVAVVAVVGLLAGAAITRFGHDTLSVTDGSGLARKLTLSLNRARRSAISEGVNAAVEFDRASGAVTGLRLVRAASGGDEPLEDPLTVPNGVTVTTAHDRWEFDFTGVLVTPSATGTIRVSAPGWYWDVTAYATTGHVRCDRVADP